MDLSKPVATPGAAPVTSPFAALIAMFYEPGKTFAALEPRRATWLPLLLVMLCTGVLMVWYFNFVDFDWMMDQMFSTMKDPAQRAKARSVMSRQLMTISAGGQALLAIPITFALMGLYFMIAGKMTSKEFTFGKGFSLAAWSSVPMLLSLPLGAIAILLASGGQLNVYDLNPVSLNGLLFHKPMGDPLASFLASINVVSIWSAILMVIGFQAWAHVPRATAVKVVVIPYVIIYGAWLAYALSRAA